MGGKARVRVAAYVAASNADTIGLLLHLAGEVELEQHRARLRETLHARSRAPTRRLSIFLLLPLHDRRMHLNVADVSTALSRAAFFFFRAAYAIRMQNG